MTVSPLGCRGPRFLALRAQERHPQGGAGSPRGPDHHRERDEVLLCRGLRLQDGNGLLVRRHDAEDLQVRQLKSKVKKT